MTYHLVFDATDPKSPRFIELEDSTGHSISAGEWKQRKDGYVELVLPAPLSKDCTQTSFELLQRFADQYRSGAAGAEMDCDAAQALAEAIDSLLPAPAAPLVVLELPEVLEAIRVHMEQARFSAINECAKIARDSWPYPNLSEDCFTIAQGISTRLLFLLPSPPKPLSYEGEQTDPLQLKWKNQFTGKGE